MVTQKTLKFFGQLLVINVSVLGLSSLPVSATQNVDLVRNNLSFNAEDLVVEPKSTQGEIPIIGGGYGDGATQPLIPNFSQAPNNSRTIVGDLDMGFGPEGCNRPGQLSVCVYDQ
ncbi:hypothetical protein [Nodosilinea sp. P-1105]|uniref:hypothetical protein n=1 Tax=Nodosilinea sp. P-1105 TaxID=2546229 RepID=UPI00146E0B26|nr:hypothetical protein [Nodosilinea sp. P-1105]NMF83370.1 hypothetical protein [Nodosilinea sp. P-1105]